jgi:hypothetical protein
LQLKNMFMLKGYKPNFGGRPKRTTFPGPRASRAPMPH